MNGNLAADPYKAMTIAYNHLNLPRLFTWTGGGFQGNSVEILYDAAGTKLRKTVKTGATVNYVQDYIGGIEYRDNVREAIHTAEGRVFHTSPTTTRYEYTLKDHLGNARLSFSDLNGNGAVDVTASPGTNELLQENHYYPFGLGHDGPWVNDAARDNRYQYNGKEWNDDFALNLNDYGARWYDAAVGRFPTIDPVSGVYSSWTPYAYTMNNPLKFIDPTGMMSEAYSFAFTSPEMSLWDMAERNRQQAEDSRMQSLIRTAEENGGHYDFVPVFEVHESKYPAVYLHTVLAQMSGHSTVLTYDSNQENAKVRRTEATRGHTRFPGMHNDEYPYASTEEGGSGASIMPVMARQNEMHGGDLRWFYAKNLKNGDSFIVRPVPDMDSPSPVFVPSPNMAPKTDPGGRFPSLAPILIRSGSIAPFFIFLDPEFMPSPSPPSA